MGREVPAMQFFAILRRRTETFGEADFAPLLESEAERVRGLYAEGKVRNAWSRGDHAGGVLLLECEDAREVDALVASLPLARRDMLEVQIIPVRGYRGFGPRAEP